MENIKMTKSQKNKLEWARKDAERLAREHFINGEVKTFEIEPNDYFISVYVVIGDVGDENDLRAIY